MVHKQLASPAYRSALVTGKARSTGFRGIVQCGVIYVLADVMRLPIRYEAWAIGAVLCKVMLGSALFSTFSLIIACIVKTRERFMGVGQVLTMPLFFASSAIYPLELMPEWLKVVARFNPLNYLVDALRSLMVPGADVSHIGSDLGSLTVICLVLIAFAVILYPGLVQ